jgi:hypothetical protein
MNMTTTELTKKAASPAASTANITDLVANMRPDLAKTMTVAQGMLKMATAMTITNGDDLAYAQGELKSVVGAAKRLEERRQAFSVPLNAALKEVNSAFKPVSEVLGQAGDKLRNLTGAYLLAQERARAEEEAARVRLARIEAARREAEQREADRAAEAQRAEVARLEAERVALAEDAQRRAADLVESATTQAEALLAAGDSAGSAVASQIAADAMRAETDAKAAVEVLRGQAVASIEAINEAAVLSVVTYSPAAAPTEPEKVDGVSWKKSLKHEVTDIVKLCAFVASNPTMAHLVLPNDAEIKKLVKQFGKNVCLPGVTVQDAMDVKVRA